MKNAMIPTGGNINVQLTKQLRKHPKHIFNLCTLLFIKCVTEWS